MPALSTTVDLSGDYVSVTAAAVAINRCEMTVRRAYRAGELVGVRRGKHLLISRASLQGYLEKRDTATEPGASTSPQVATREAGVTLNG